MISKISSSELKKNEMINSMQKFFLWGISNKALLRWKEQFRSIYSEDKAQEGESVRKDNESTLFNKGFSKF